MPGVPSSRSCTNCRKQRKKCDELKPMCSRCTRLSLQCIGAGVKRFKFVAQKPSTGRTASDHLAAWGKGACQNTLLAESGQKVLAKALITMLGPEPGQSSFVALYGPCFGWLPAQIGLHPALDAAIAYALQGHRLFRGIEGTESAVLKSGSTAAACLRKAVMMPPLDISDPVLMAMIVHTAAECFRGIGTLNYAFHILALTSLLEKRVSAGKYDVLEMTLMHTIFLEEVVESTYAGTDSTFDRSWWPLETPMEPSQACFMPAMTLHRISSKIIRIPRLLRLLRLLECNPGESRLKTRVETLTRSLHHYDPKCVPCNLNEVLASCHNGDQPLAASSSWSLQDHTLALLYCTYRVLICGIVQRLHGFDVGLLDDICPQATRLEDASAARSIAALAKIALAPSTDIPWLALRACTPLLISYGSWHRLEGAMKGKKSKESQTLLLEAVSMKRLCSKLFAQMLTVWNRNSQGLPIERIALVFSGGPLLPEMSLRNIKWDHVPRDVAESM